MKSPIPVFLTLFLILLTLLNLSTATTLTPAAKPLRLTNRCRPATIQRDALCACYTCTTFGLANRSFTRRCMRLFRTDMRSMKRSCNIYMVRTPRGQRFQSRRLLRNLRFIDSRCPKMLNRAGVNLRVAGRMLTNFQIRQRIDRVLAIVKDMLAHLEPVPAVTAAPARMIVEGDEERKRVARLRQYNDIQE